MSYEPTSREIRRQDKNELEHVGFQRNLRARHGTLLLVLSVGLAIVAIVTLCKLDVFTVDTAVQASVATTALFALLIGLPQWRAARDEISLDKIYEKLEEMNKLLDEWREVRDFAGPRPILNGQGEQGSYRRRMYVYRELDNFEYAVEKYRIGFMEPQTAHRSLRTFQARCKESDEFCGLALEYVNTTGYSRETRQIVQKVVQDTVENASASRPEGYTKPVGRIRLVVEIDAPLTESKGCGEDEDTSGSS
jgi:hypothetical protein